MVVEARCSALRVALVGREPSGRLSTVAALNLLEAIDLRASLDVAIAQLAEKLNVARPPTEVDK